MAGIGFELRKLFRKEGLLNNLRAYAYSSMTTVGPMILCMSLIIILQRMMSMYNGSYIDWELYIATVSYCFIFSIVITSGISLVITRYVSDCLYTHNYHKLMSSYYGVLSIVIPITTVISVIFLSQVQADLTYKISAYLFFVFLVIIWIQGVYLSALKDYIRIARSFIIGALIVVLVAWVLMDIFSVSTLISAFIGLDVGFFIICFLTGFHFQQKFPKANPSFYFEFFSYLKKFPLLFFSGCLVYSGIYLHNFVYWFSDNGSVINGAYRVYMFYDVPVFYAFLSVMPTLVTFVVSVETSFFEKFRHYYLNVLTDGTVQDIQNAKKQMQKTLMREISFLMEIQLLFTVLSIGIGILLLPKIGFTMQQIDLFIILSLAYYLFIMFFSFVHVLMYFDDQKGVFFVGLLFFALNIICTLITMKSQFHGLGMFIASFIALIAVSGRLLYVVRNIDYYTFCAQPIHTKAKKSGKRKNFRTGAVTMLIAACMLISACSVADDTLDDLKTSGSAAIAGEVSYALMDDKRLYERDQDDSLKALYLTILPKKDGAVSFDWYELNRQVNKELGQELEVIVQEGLPDGKGPKAGMFEYGAAKANASIGVRGNSTWSRVQKSYKLKLYEDAGLYLDQQRFNFNKHIDDMSRIRNKLSFDLMETIPDMTSLRTQFVQLYVKDLSNGEKDAPYQDYGLFTHVEQPNKKFLKAHMLDPNGYLYKTKFFEFFRYPDQVKSTNDSSYDVAKFEEILEIKGREDHDKLIEMLDAVNDYSIPIDETVEKYFDLDNFLTWTAMNILMDNMDTNSQNFFLYSPLNVDKWYFLPWDYDGGWEMSFEFSSAYQQGISNYWGVLLHNRYFRSQVNVDKLTDKIEELYQYINEETVKNQIGKYQNIVEPFINRLPDLQYLPDKTSNYEQDIQRIIDTPKLSLERYYDDLEKPKPFYLGEAVEIDGKLQFNWDISFDLQDDKLTYELTVAKDLALTDIVYENKQLIDNVISIPMLEKGHYYWSVMVVDSKGNRQYNFDDYIDENGVKHNGIKDFEVD